MSYGSAAIWINVGDTVRWIANSVEPHTVSFTNAAHPAAPFSPAIGYMVTRTPQTSIGAPGEFRNSGILATMSDPSLPPAYSGYRLRFTGVGTYHYLCYIHGAAMQGVVHVRRAGRPYPYSQGWYNAQTTRARLAMIEHGLNLWANAIGQSTNQHVFIGAADMTAMVMRYVPSHITVRKNQTVVFDMAMNTIPEPHTVTFGAEPSAPFIVQGDPTSYSGGNLNSGVLLPAAFAGPGGHSTFSVRFTTVGTYPFKCMFHDSMGMTGVVTVVP